MFPGLATVLAIGRFNLLLIGLLLLHLICSIMSRVNGFGEGVNVFCEKPASLSPQAVIDLYNLADQRGCCFMLMMFTLIIHCQK